MNDKPCYGDGLKGELVGKEVELVMVHAPHNCHLIDIFPKETAAHMHDKILSANIYAYQEYIFHLIKSPIYVLHKYNLQFFVPVSAKNT